MKNGGLVLLWNTIAICEMFKIFLGRWENTLSETRRKTTEGPIIPFGAEVQCRPISTNDQSRLHQFGKKVLPGICLGYALVARRIWKGDIMVADIEELGKFRRVRNPRSETQRTRNANVQKGETFIFPIEDGTVK